ncbi:MAG: cyclopropane-fatty-acyl-phospholipid synthase family protein [Sphingobium sp.]|uniref:cyclopropane-fatty-acyl-phospholipid synthase family protein n=1 Tax=Sphingobium sp. TaxID=1912891 RepID=UPI0029B9F4AA|nr:cyclopropane-fatty-acyl-phospholipid synthase family protein [Sphingobium sp.]MDX3909825.1 cyclopropane-fatty-acyl-phospholipid synthase family protein [Sphingobium sp.]
MQLFGRFLKTLIQKGALEVVDFRGRRYRFGDQTSPVAPVCIRFTDRATPRRATFNPALELGEAYMDGRMVVERGDILSFLDLIGLNTHWDDDDAVRLRHWRPWRHLGRLDTWNWQRRSRRNVAHHYDLSDRLYRLFLDDDLQYSCGYFPDPGIGLEEAQAAKKAHIAAKLALRPGLRVLDIGCGWGGMALYLNKVADVDVLGITLSQEQLSVARERATTAGVADRLTFELLDYRAVSGQFDRIVSVGMFEHVGPPHYRTFFDHCRRLLKPDGVMLLHTIGRADGPAPTDRWLARYIFPGGYVPALSQIAPAVEDARLWITDIEVLRLHYARTLRHWYARTTTGRQAIVDLYDERFFRMWQFYLAGAIVAFEHDAHLNFQIQLTRRREALPLTRDYMTSG